MFFVLGFVNHYAASLSVSPSVENCQIPILCWNVLSHARTGGGAEIGQGSTARGVRESRESRNRHGPLVRSCARLLLGRCTGGRVKPGAAPAPCGRPGRTIRARNPANARFRNAAPSSLSFFGGGQGYTRMGAVSIKKGESAPGKIYRQMKIHVTDYPT